MNAREHSDYRDKLAWTVIFQQAAAAAASGARPTGWPRDYCELEAAIGQHGFEWAWSEFLHNFSAALIRASFLPCRPVISRENGRRCWPVLLSG